MKKYISRLIIISLILGSLIGCGKKEEESLETGEIIEEKKEEKKEEVKETKKEEVKEIVQEGEKVYREAVPVDATTINPHRGTLNYDGIVMDYCTGSLYREMPSADGTALEFIDELADGEPIQVDDEGKVWQIKIDPSAKWANGDQINADTFIYSYKMLLDPVLFSSRATVFAKYFIEIENAAKYALQGTEGYPDEMDWEEVGIKKIDDYTIEIHTVDPYSSIDVMRHFKDRPSKPVYEPYYEELMNDSRTETGYGTSLDTFMSCGPYIFDTWVQGAERIYIKNEDSPIADKINIEKVVFKIVPDAGTRLQMFENGELDIIGVDANSYAKYEEDPRLITVPTVSIFHFEINRTNPEQPIFKDVDFRRALFYAMDRNVYAELLNAKPAPYYLHHLAFADAEKGILYRDLPEAKALVPPNGGYDPEYAKECFDAAMERAGLDTITVKVLIEDTGDILKVMGEHMQKHMPEIFGEDRFKIEMVNMPDQQKTATMNAWETQPTGYEIGGHLFNNAATSLNPYLQFRPYTTEYQRYTHYGNDKYDALYKETESAEVRLDQEKMIEHLLALEEEFIDNVMNLPTIEFQGHYMFSDRVILPVEEYLPSVGFGLFYADIDTSK